MGMTLEENIDLRVERLRHELKRAAGLKCLGEAPKGSNVQPVQPAQRPKECRTKVGADTEDQPTVSVPPPIPFP